MLFGKFQFVVIAIRPYCVFLRIEIFSLLQTLLDLRLFN